MITRKVSRYQKDEVPIETNLLICSIRVLSGCPHAHGQDEKVEHHNGGDSDDVDHGAEREKDLFLDATSF